MVKTKLLKGLMAAVSVVVLFGLASCAGADEGGSGTNGESVSAANLQELQIGKWDGVDVISILNCLKSSSSTPRTAVARSMTDSETGKVARHYLACSEKYYVNFLKEVGLEEYNLLWCYKKDPWTTASDGRQKYRDTLILIDANNKKLAQFEQIWDCNDFVDMLLDKTGATDTEKAWVEGLTKSSSNAQKGVAFKKVGDYNVRTGYDPSEYKVITFPAFYGSDHSKKTIIHRHYKYDENGEISTKKSDLSSVGTYYGFRDFSGKVTQTYILEDSTTEGKCCWKLCLPSKGDGFYFVSLTESSGYISYALEAKGVGTVDGSTSKGDGYNSLSFTNKDNKLFVNSDSSTVTVDLSSPDLTGFEKYIYISKRNVTVAGESVPSFIRIKASFAAGADFTGDYLNIELVPVIQETSGSIIYVLKTENDVPVFCTKYYEATADLAGYANKATDWFEAEYCTNCGTEYKTLGEADACSKQSGCPSFTSASE